MSQRELTRLEIIQRLLQKEYSNAHAAELLRLCVRQVKRLKKKVRRLGAAGLIHASRGRVGHHRLDQSEHETIVELLRKHYHDFKPTFAAEKLHERHHIDHDPKTIRSIMIQEHLWTPKKVRAGSEHRSWRLRRSSFGEMQQFDGSYEYWFEDRAPKCCLLASIDDARGTITKAQFALHEGVVPVFTFWREYLQTHGKPLSIYMDKFSTYKMPERWIVQNHDLKTQFQRAMSELGIEPIFAHSPQAKGRVERLFETLQDRLVKELRLQGISTMEEGTRFLKEIFIPKFNAQFGVEPRSTTDSHRSLTAKEQQNMDAVFSRQYERTIGNDFTVSFHNHWYQITKDQPVTVCKKDAVTIEERLGGSVWIRLRGKYLHYALLQERPKKVAAPWVIPKTRILWKPPVEHPWRKPLLLKVAQG